MNIIETSEAKAMKKLRIRRKKNNECTRCGHKLPTNYDFNICPECKEYAKSYRLPKHITNDELGFLQFKKRRTPTSGIFGRNLKELMLKNIDSPKSLARSLNVSTKTVDSWLYRNQIQLHR